MSVSQAKPLHYAKVAVWARLPKKEDDWAFFKRKIIYSFQYNEILQQFVRTYKGN